RTREVGPRHSSYEAGEQSERAHCGGIYRGKRSGAGGAKGGGQGECAPAKHALDSEPGSRVTGAGAYTASNCRHTPEVGAVCGKAARTVLCGGRDENRVPTATTARLIRLIFKPVKSALLALKVSGMARPRHFGFILRSRPSLAPLHSITSSARTRIPVGNSMPIALATLRLITSSNFDACSTGRSAGLVPLSTRAT